MLVRKRAIRALWECCSCPGFSRADDAVVAVLQRANDKEDSMKSLVTKICGEMWFTEASSFAGTPCGWRRWCAGAWVPVVQFAGSKHDTTTHCNGSNSLTDIACIRLMCRSAVCCAMHAQACLMLTQPQLPAARQPCAQQQCEQPSSQACPSGCMRQGAASSTCLCLPTTA